MAKPGLDGHDRGIKVLASAYRDSGMPTDDEPGCSSGGTMNTSTGTVTKTCTFGTASSSGGCNKILILFKLASGDYIQKLKFSA